MVKNVKCKAPGFKGMPKAPWIFVGDPTVGRELSALIPGAVYIRANSASAISVTCDKPVVITSCNTYKDDRNFCKLSFASELRTRAMKCASNFASINVTEQDPQGEKGSPWGTNHLDCTAGDDTAVKIYRWLFTILTVRESLYLIPDEEMRKIDLKTFPDYQYCPIVEANSRPRDAKLQFVGLVLSKPQVQEGQKLTWSVADKSGVANFYFQYRDNSSQYTWDWVLNLKPGERRALPRMPRVEIKEKKRIRALKAPLRATAAVLIGTNIVLSNIGSGFDMMGQAMKMGASSRWVPEADIKSDSKKTPPCSSPCAGPVQAVRKTIQVFNEKGEKAWSDGASIASTDIGSELDEKSGKEFI